MSLSERAQPPTSLDRTPVVPLADKDRDYFYVICGHKNPDPDSVCSAIGYAELKYLQHPDVPRGPNVVGRRPKWAACRCGESNARIDAILKRFGVEDPPLYSSITPRLKHIMTMAKQIVLTYKGTTCAEVMQIMERCGHHILPVIDPEKVTGRPFTGICGAISFDSLGLHFLPRPGDLHSLKRVTTSVDNIVRSLNAKPCNPKQELFNPTRIQEFITLFLSWTVEEAEAIVAQGNVDLTRTVVVTTNNAIDIQRWAVEKGVSMLVISGVGMYQYMADHEVSITAHAKGINVICSPMDITSVLWSLRGAALIDPLLTNNFLGSFQVEDRLADVRKRLHHSDTLDMGLVFDEQREHLVGLFTRKDLTRPSRMRLIMVDHNELTQAIPGAEEIEITEIIDHHRLGNPATTQPVLFINRPVGSTCTIVADLYRQYGLAPSKQIAGVLMGGIVTDTLNLKGPTTTAVDVNVLSWLATIAEEDPNALAEVIFNAGSVFVLKTPQESLKYDFKEFREGEFRFSVSQVEELGFANFWKCRDELVAALEELRARENFNFSALLVTDINTQKSLFVVRAPQEFLEKIHYAEADSSGTIFELPFVSRKLQVVPYITRLIKLDESE